MNDGRSYLRERENDTKEAEVCHWLVISLQKMLDWVDHRSWLFAYMIGETLEEMKDKLKEHQIIFTNSDVNNMKFPDACQDEVLDIDTDTREDLILMHEHSQPNTSMQEV